MGRLSKHQKKFKKEFGMTPLEFSRMVKRRVGEQIDRELCAKKSSE